VFTLLVVARDCVVTLVRIAMLMMHLHKPSKSRTSTITTTVRWVEPK
jgi:hypothetical protein